MNKKLIRLTESDLHRIVKESVNRILMESKGLDPSKRDSEFASNIKWSGEPDLDKANEWRKSWHNTHRGEKKVKGDTKFRDMARRENERGNFVHKLKTNPNDWFEKSVKESIDSFTSVLLPRKGWKTLATWKLNIEYNGELVYAIENRPENGEVFLLSNEGDGYHVIGYFSDLEPSQQDAIKNLLMQKMGVM